MRAMPWRGLFVSGITFAIGLFFLATPERASRLWGQRLAAGAGNSAIYRRLYRMAGALLCAAAVLIAAETLLYAPPPPPVRRLPPAGPITRLTAPVAVTNVKV